MADDNKASWIAVVGVIITVLSFYYARKEAGEKAAENRPVIEVADGQLVNRQLNTNKSSRSMVTPRHKEKFDTESKFFYSATFRLANRGHHVATNISLEVVGGIEGLTLYQQSGPGHIAYLRDLAPEETVEQVMTVPDKIMTSSIIPFKGIMRYSDKLDRTKKYEEPFCFQARLPFDFDEYGRTVLGFVVDEFKYYKPPLKMGGCQIEPAK